MPLPDVEDLRAPGVGLVAGSITDLAGVTRAKYVPLSRLGGLSASGHGRLAVVERVLCRQWYRVHPEHRRGRRPPDPHRSRRPSTGHRRHRLGPRRPDRPAGRGRGPVHPLAAQGDRISLERKGFDRNDRRRARVHDAVGGRRPRLHRSLVALRCAHLAGSLGVPGRPGRSRRARGAAGRADPHRIRPRPARGIPGPVHPCRGRRHGRGGPHRDRTGGGQARPAHLLLPGSVRG